LPYLNAVSDKQITCKIFPQTSQNSPNRATGNAVVAITTLTHVKVAARCDFFMKSLLRFCKFLVLVNSNFVSKLTTTSESQ